MNTSDADVIVIGSGAGGGACAWALARYGIRVLLLEAGSAYGPPDYRLDKPDWEQTRFPDGAKHKGRYIFAALQGLLPQWDSLMSWSHTRGRINRATNRMPDAYQHMRGVGGSTLVFSAEAQRLHPRAMQLKTLSGIGADWPLTYKDIEPYYCEAEWLTGVAGPAGDMLRPRSRPYPLPPHSMSFASTKIAQGCSKLGLSWVENPVAILSRSYDGRPPCNYCANCNRGCQRTDKGSADVTFIKKAVESGFCTVMSEYLVTRLVAGPADRITEVHCRDSGDKEHVLRPGCVVVACGAVETPRLLLASTNRFAPQGVGNESGLVGRNFMETIFWTSTGLHPEQLGSFRGIPVDSACWDFNAPGSVPEVAGGCRFKPGVIESDLLGPISYAQRLVRGWGREHKAAMRRAFGNALSVGAIGESFPNDQSYIDLDPVEKDSYGVPLARIHSFLSDMQIRLISFMAGKCRDILHASGVDTIIEEYGAYDYFSSSHVFGTCRMGTFPATSVVNPYCRSHRWRNLFIADTSVFPSSGGGEAPSLTAEALAIRTAVHIRERALRREL